jgi:hypothetical protein
LTAFPYRPLAGRLRPVNVTGFEWICGAALTLAAMATWAYWVVRHGFGGIDMAIGLFALALAVPVLWYLWIGPWVTDRLLQLAGS